MRNRFVKLNGSHLEQKTQDLIAQVIAQTHDFKDLDPRHVAWRLVDYKMLTPGPKTGDKWGWPDEEIPIKPEFMKDRIAAIAPFVRNIFTNGQKEGAQFHMYRTDPKKARELAQAAVDAGVDKIAIEPVRGMVSGRSPKQYMRDPIKQDCSVW